jgi:hypothetical protein
MDSDDAMLVKRNWTANMLIWIHKVENK